MPFQPREIDALQHDHQQQHGGIEAQHERDAILHGETTDSIAETNSREGGKKLVCLLIIIVILIILLRACCEAIKITMKIKSKN